MSFDENDIGATYVYKLTETAGTDTSIEYSKEEFFATVTVIDSGEIGEDGKGVLNTEVHYYKDAECLEELEKVTFTNKYHASGELVLDQVQKVLKNADLTAGRFSFELKDADGKAAFEKLSYTEKDIDHEYVYTVSEVNAGEEGISYDGAVYTVTVKVEDGENSDGSLKLTTVISNGTEETDAMTFTNTFEGAVKLTKTSEDGKVLAGAEFQLFVDQKDGNDQAYASEASANGLYVTNENGVLEVTKLPAGDYYFIETKAPKGYVISKDADGKPVKYPFSIAAEKEKVNAEVSVVNAGGTEGSIIVTKRTTMSVGEEIKDVKIRNAVFYVGIFKDAEGKQPYGTDHVKAIRMVNEKISESIVFSGLKTGTYYILETDAAGNPIPLNQVQESGDTTFVCQIDGAGTNEVKLDLAADAVEGKVNLNNMYYELPEGYYLDAEISITKKVLRNGKTSTEEDTFYAGIFTKEADGTMKLFEVTELKQNGTVTVTVPLGGENGVDPITYYVYETNETGVPVDKATFVYEVSGEGSVNLDVKNPSGAITITNAIEDIEETEETEIIEETEETTEAAPKAKNGVNTGDDTPLALYWTMLGASLIALIGLYGKKRKKNNA